MVERYKVRRPERENTVVTFPAPQTPPTPRPGAEPVEQYECQACGRKNPAKNQFCGACGAPRERTAAPAPPRSIESKEPAPPPSNPDSAIKHHHHHHHHYRSSPYLLFAVVLLLGVVTWQQWWVPQQHENKPVSAPVLRAQPPAQAPAQSQPNPATDTTTPAAVPGQDASSSQAKKPAVRTSTARPSVRPIRQMEPLGPAVRAPQGPAGPPIAPYQALTDRPIPVLPSFSSLPPKPAASK